MKTIAQQIKWNFAKEGDLVISNAKGNRIYHENSDGYWLKREYDEKGNQIYYENSDGKVIDNRPKCENKVVAQQTAVEWLFIQLYEKFEMKGDGMEMDKVFEQAKEMEKEQIVKAYTNGSPEFFDMAEEYYNETFNNKQ